MVVKVRDWMRLPRQPRTVVQGKISRQQLFMSRQRKNPGRGTKVLIPEKEKRNTRASGTEGTVSGEEDLPREIQEIRTLKYPLDSAQRVSSVTLGMMVRGVLAGVNKWGRGECRGWVILSHGLLSFSIEMLV